MLFGNNVKSRHSHAKRYSGFIKPYRQLRFVRHIEAASVCSELLAEKFSVFRIGLAKLKLIGYTFKALRFSAATS